MSNLEGVAPESLEAQAIAELQAEGNVIGEHQPINDEGEIEPEVIAEAPAEKQKETPKEETVADEPADEPTKRTPTMVEAWKLKVAEDQKESAIKQAQELQAKIDELSKQNSPITQTQREDIVDDIKALAEESGVDETFLNKFANTIISKTEAKAKPLNEITKALEELTREREIMKQENAYSEEFNKDIEPLVKEQYGLSDTALLQLKNKLKDFAFSETYAKVPLAKIFKAEFDALDIKESKKSSEGKGVKMRSNEVIDYDNLTEEQFASMTPEQIEAFTSRHTGKWQIPK